MTEPPRPPLLRPAEKSSDRLRRAIAAYRMLAKVTRRVVDVAETGIVDEAQQHRHAPEHAG
jgi:hypothetical protein